MDHLIDRILKAIRPPEDAAMWNQEPWERTWEVIYGAGVGLCASRQTIGHRLGRMHEYAKERERLWDSLASFCSDREVAIDWEKPPFVLWSAGYFLNNSQRNVSSAFDRILNHLLKVRLPTFAEEFQHTWIKPRASLLLSLGLSAEIEAFGEEIVKATNLLADLADPSTPEIAPSWLLAKASECVHLEHLDDIVHELESVPRALSLLIAWERFNWFKHHIRGAHGRFPTESRPHPASDRVSMVEWAVSLQALEFVASFWKECVAAHHRGDLEPVVSR